MAKKKRNKKYDPRKHERHASRAGLMLGEQAFFFEAWDSVMHDLEKGEVMYAEGKPIMRMLSGQVFNMSDILLAYRRTFEILQNTAYADWRLERIDDVIRKVETPGLLISDGDLTAMKEIRKYASHALIASTGHELSDLCATAETQFRLKEQTA